MGGDDDDDDEVRKQPQLKPQNAETVDATKLTALSPEVVSSCLVMVDLHPRVESVE